jgi:biopolymer transport protein ExbB/TolQ
MESFFHFSVGNVLMILGFFASGALAVFTLSWQMAREFEKQHEKNMAYLKNLETDLEAKRARIYQRIDEVKCHADNVFVRKDICDVVHRNTVQIVEKIERRMEEWMKEIKSLIKNGHEGK